MHLPIYAFAFTYIYIYICQSMHLHLPILFPSVVCDDFGNVLSWTRGSGAVSISQRRNGDHIAIGRNTQNPLDLIIAKIPEPASAQAELCRLKNHE